MKRSCVMARGGVAGSSRSAYVVAALGILAVTTRCPEPWIRNGSSCFSSSASRCSCFGRLVRVTTDLLIAEIDTLGATLKRAELTRHKDSKEPAKDFVLLGPEHLYEAQSGITGDAGPNHRTAWRCG